MNEKYIYDLTKDQVNWLLGGGITEIEEIREDGEKVTIRIRISKFSIDYFNNIFKKGLKQIEKEEEEWNLLNQ